MPISFFLIVTAAVLLRIPALEAARKLRTGAAAPAGKLRAMRFAFDSFSCLALLLAVWRLPAGGLSGFDLGVLRYCGLAVVAAALLIDGASLLYASTVKPPNPPSEPEM